jgi:histone acetyltransferase (RNA polymerase elongator complex component)
VERYASSIKRSVTRIELAFFGGSFTGINEEKQTELLEAVLPFRKSGFVHAIRISTRPDYIDENKLSLLARFGVTTIELGAQSFSDDVLTASFRGHSAEDTVRAARLIREKGFDLVIQLMPGLPLDTRELSVFSALKAVELNPSSVRIYPTVVMAGTELARLFSSGNYSPLSLEEAIGTCKEMYLIFKNSGIPVIRMGLHPLGPEEQTDILAGPYHPAFGFLVKSRVKRDELANLIGEHLRHTTPTGIHLSLPARDSEEYIGHRKSNILYLKEHFGLERLEYRIEKTAAPAIHALEG